MKNLILLSLFCVTTAHAQFSDINSFFYDTLLQSGIRTNKVRTVSEWQKDTVKQYNGYYVFDAKGRVIKLSTARNGVFYRKHFAYNNANAIIEDISYVNGDTTHIESWKKRTYDAKNRLLLEERGQHYGGKDLKGKSIEVTYSTNKKGAEVRRYKSYIDYRPEPSKSTVSYDSLAGDIKYTVNFESEGSGSQQDPQYGERTLVRTYTKNNGEYSDMVTYRAFGKNQIATAVSSTYVLYDDKKRLLEYGSITYEEAFMDFAQEHPDDYSEGSYSPSFITALYAGQITGKKKIELKTTYNALGQIETKSQDNWRYTLNYNAKNQVSDYTLEGEEGYWAKMEIWYNEQGLITKTLQSTWNVENEAEPKQSFEFLYTYTYF